MNHGRFRANRGKVNNSRQAAGKVPKGDKPSYSSFDLTLTHRLIQVACMIAVALAVSACERNADAPKSPTTSSAWREFEGSWNAAGTRRTIPLGDGQQGSIIDLRGSMLLAGAERPDVGFRCEIIEAR